MSLAFALDAVEILESADGGWSLSVANALRLVGTASRRLNRLDDSLESLTASYDIIATLRNENCGDAKIVSAAIAVLEEIVKTKTAMGRKWEAAGNLRMLLEIKAAVADFDREALADTIQESAEAFAAVLDFQQSLSLSLQALEIYKERFGSDSSKVAGIRKLLGIVYIGLGENAKALTETELARRAFERLGLATDVVHLDIAIANIQVLLGRAEAAADTLRSAMLHVDKDSELRAAVLAAMAKALLSIDGRTSDARRCLEIAAGILDGKVDSVAASMAETYAEISMAYEVLGEFEAAESLMKRTLAVLRQLSPEAAAEMHHLEASMAARLGWLLLFTKKAAEAIPHLESAVEKLKGCFGPSHFGLGFVYKHLGQAYAETNQLPAAAKLLTLARHTIEGALGPHHEDTIDVNQCLANAYGLMQRYEVAMEYQQRVIEAWEGVGADAADEIAEAHRLLQQLKMKSRGSPSAVFPANALPASLLTAASKIDTPQGT